MFRGRGGPTDGRLPKQNARRRKNPPSSSGPAVSSMLQDDTSFDTLLSTLPQSNDKGSRLLAPDVEKEDRIGANCALVQAATISECHVEDADSFESQEQGEDSDKSILFRNEAKHITDRIRRCRDTIQLSATAISIPSNYEKHVLNSVLNTVNEWKAILRHYPTDQVDPVVARSIAVAVFDLIQHALQCGPLSGSKAGYWKRCGSEMAAKGFSFLDSIAPTAEASISMLFSERQAQTLLKWKLDAKKEVTADNPPSNFVSKQTKEAETAKAQAHIALDKKKQRRLLHS
jgi:hypothetical protein